MNATINVVCYKWKVLANGECPLMIRVAKDKKRTMKSLGISVNPKHWDFIIDRLEPLNIEARYPSYKERLMKSLSKEYCQQLLKDTKELQQWIKNKP